MEIRPMTITDYPGVYELWASSAGMGLNNLDDSEGGIGRFLDRNPTTCCSDRRKRDRRSDYSRSRR